MYAQVKHLSPVLSFVTISECSKVQVFIRHTSIMCSSRKNPYPPHGRSLEIPRGRGVLKAKLEFPGGMGGAKQKTFRRGSMDIF